MILIQIIEGKEGKNRSEDIVCYLDLIGMNFLMQLQKKVENNHGKTKSARIQKRNVFSTDKNEM